MSDTLTIPVNGMMMKMLRAYAAQRAVTLEDAAADLLWNRLLGTLPVDVASGLPKAAAE